MAVAGVVDSAAAHAASSTFRTVIRNLLGSRRRGGDAPRSLLKRGGRAQVGDVQMRLDGRRTATLGRVTFLEAPALKRNPLPWHPPSNFPRPARRRSRSS